MSQPGHEITAPQSGGPMRVLCISGSLRRDSYNRKLLSAASGLAPPTAELVQWGGLKALPPFDEDDEHTPGPAVFALREAIARADALLIATPQYNASLPGQLKNALDWASRPYETNVLRGKPVAVIGASPSPSGAARSQAEARTVLAAIGADVLDTQLALARAHEQFDSYGQLAADTPSPRPPSGDANPNQEDSSMYAILRRNSYDATKLAHAEPALAEFQAMHAAQPGYCGSIVVDIGDGQRVAVNLWATERDAAAGQTALVPHLRRLLEPLMSGPSQLVGAGEVVASDLARSGPTTDQPSATTQEQP